MLRGWIRRTLLASIPLFESLSPEDSDYLGSRLEERDLDEGEEIFDKGDPGDTMYVILDGAVEILAGQRQAAGGAGLAVPGPVLRRAVAARRRAALGHGDRGQAHKVLALDRDDFVEFVRSKPDAALIIMAEIAERMRATNEPMTQTVTRNVFTEEEENDDPRRARRRQGRGLRRLVDLHLRVRRLHGGVDGLQRRRVSLRWDEYPFILLNLMLSSLAALQAPVIMMSQNRQAEKDKALAVNTYQVNLKQEIVIDKIMRGQNEVLQRVAMLERSLAPRASGPPRAPSGRQRSRAEAAGNARRLSDPPTGLVGSPPNSGRSHETSFPCPGRDGAACSLAACDSGMTTRRVPMAGCTSPASGVRRHRPDPGAADPDLLPDVHDYYVRCNAGDNPMQLKVLDENGWDVQDVDLTEDQLLTVRDDYHVRCLPHDFPEITVTRHPENGDPTPGWYLVNSASYAAVLDQNGVPVWYAKGDTVLNVDAQKPNVVSFMRHGQTPFVNNVDSAFSVWTLDGSVPPVEVKTVGLAPDFHDFRMLPNGNYLLLTYPLEPHVDLTGLDTYGSDETLADCELQEIDPQGNEVWSWLASDHVDPVKESLEPSKWMVGNDNVVDTFHCNSMDVDASGNILLSMRQANTVLYIDRTTGTIQWKLGGTDLQQGRRASTSRSPATPRASSACSTTPASTPTGRSRCSTTTARQPTGSLAASSTRSITPPTPRPRCGRCWAPARASTRAAVGRRTTVTSSSAGASSPATSGS